MAANVNSFQSGIVEGTDLNQPSVSVHRGTNLFPQSFLHPSSSAYGIVDPVCFAKCEPGDIFPYKFVTDLNTFTLKSPMKSKVKRYQAAFKVPMEAIYPRNYELMLPIPNKGDDVPADTRAIFNPKKLLDVLLSTFTSNNLDNRIISMFIMEQMFSDGGIFAKANIHMNDVRFSHKEDGSYRGADWFDRYFDLYFIPWLRELLFSDGTYLEYYDQDELPVAFRVTQYDDQVGQRVDSSSNPQRYYISFARAVELLRSGEYDVITGVEDPTEFLNSFPTPAFSSVYYTTIDIDLNIEPIIAYQLACAHFFNNPKIDYIYSAQLFRDNLENIFISNSLAAGAIQRSFVYNGIRKYYDVFSAKYFNIAYNTAFLDYWLTLFSYHHSLRYADYFTAVHPEPIAPGDITIDGDASGASSLEIVRKLQLTRLYNKVNISGPRKDDYLKVVFGERLPDAPKDVPIRLSREESDIEGFEVNNTGDAQLSSDSPNITTTNLRLEDSKFMFEVHIDEPCWLVMVQYYEAHRIYSKTIDRFAFHYDRFDDFIPDMQFTGDQDVKNYELSGTSASDTPFAYNLRNMEYKQRYSYASGAFAHNLRSWAFVTDNMDGNPAFDRITPQYLRSSPSEFDRFYKSLSGYSLGTRYHFITFNTNVVAPYRKMVYAPEILA